MIRSIYSDVANILLDIDRTKVIRSKDRQYCVLIELKVSPMSSRRKNDWYCVCERLKRFSSTNLQGLFATNDLMAPLFLQLLSLTTPNRWKMSDRSTLCTFIYVCVYTSIFDGILFSSSNVFLQNFLPILSETFYKAL